MGSNLPSVSIRQVPGGAPNDLLEEILEAACFWKVIESARLASKLSRASFAVVLKPDLDIYSLAVSSGTDRDLVLHLAILLQQRGYESITVLDARNSRDNWLLNREPLVVADFWPPKTRFIP